MDNAGKDGGRVQLHQDGQEDVRKAPFYGQIALDWPVSVVFLAATSLPVNWNGCGECGGGSRDRQGGHWDRMITCPHRLQLQTSWTGGHLDQEDGNSERQVLGRSSFHYPYMRGWENFSVDLTVCKLQTHNCTH